MSDVVVSVTESVTDVAVTETSVDVNVTETTVDVVSGTSGPQGAQGIQGVSYNPGDPIYVTVRNATGSTMVKGTIVYTSGANGTHTQVSPALATSDATSARVLGWLAEDIANNASGLCQVEGYLDGINTQGITAGAQLYLSGSTAGGFQVTKPVAPIHLVYVGVVAKVSAGNGRVYVKVQNGYELSEIHDVAITDPANNQVLTYESSTGLWKNKDNVADGVTSVVFSAPLTGGTITSSGTVGLDQTALVIAESQVTNLETDLAAKAALTATQTFTGTQTITPSAANLSAIILKALASQTAVLVDIRDSANTQVAYIGNGGSIRSVTFGALATGQALLTMAADTGGMRIDTNAAANKGLIVKGAASQTADLLQVQDSAAAVLFRITSAGRPQVNARMGIAPTGATSNFNASLVVADVTGGANNIQEWQNSSGTMLSRVDVNGFVHAGAVRVKSGANSSITGAQISVEPQSASTIGALIRGAASQSANLQEWQSSDGSVQTVVNSSGGFATNQRGTFGTAAISSLAHLTVTQGVSGRVSLGVQNTQSSNTADLGSYFNSSSTVIGGRNANAQIFTGSTAPLTTAVGGATTAASGTGTTATLTTTSNHNLAVGDRITVAGVTPTAYNGTFIVTAAATNSVSYASAATGVQTVAGTVSVDNQVSITTRSAATAGLVIKMSASQSTDAFQLLNSSGTLISRIDPNGILQTNNYINLTNGSTGIAQSNVYRIRLDNTSASIGLGSAALSAGGGNGIVFVSNASTVPTSNPTGGGILYSEGGALKWRGSSGTITTIAVA